MRLAVVDVDELLARVREVVREELHAAAPSPAAPGVPPSPFLTVEEAAELAKRCPRTVLEWIRAGQLPAKKRARRWVIHRSALERFLTADAGDRRATESEIAAAAAKILQLPRSRLKGVP